MPSRLCWKVGIIWKLRAGRLGRFRFANAEEVWMRPEASANLNLTNLSARSCHIMPTFQHNLLGIGKLCDHGCKVLFDSNAVTAFSKYNKNILIKGWRDTTGAKLWRFYLRPKDSC